MSVYDLIDSRIYEIKNSNGTHTHAQNEMKLNTHIRAEAGLKKD